MLFYKEINVTMRCKLIVFQSIFPLVFQHSVFGKVPESFYSFKQILRKHVKTIDNFSFEKEATVVANRKDHFIYF